MSLCTQLLFSYLENTLKFKPQMALIPCKHCIIITCYSQRQCFQYINPENGKMNVIAILLTLLLVLELVEAQCKTLCSIIAANTSYNVKLCTQQECYSQTFIDRLQMCRCTINEDKNVCTSTCTSSECQNITIEISSSSPSISPSTTNTNGCEPSTHSTISLQGTGTTERQSTTTATPMQLCSCSATKALGARVALGALVGLFTVLLTLAIIGWVCTCVILKKKGTVNINKTKTR